MKRISRISVTAAVVLSIAVAGFAQSSSTFKHQDAPWVYGELAKAPEKARAKKNPLETDSQAIAAGQNLFGQHCAECHGDTAQGTRKAPSLLVSQVQNAEPGAIFWVLTNGAVRHGMPVWSKLPEPQRWQLVSFLKSLGAAKKEYQKPSPNSSQPDGATPPSIAQPSPHR